MRKLLIISLLIISTAIPSFAEHHKDNTSSASTNQAESATAHQTDHNHSSTHEKFDPGRIILEHILDAHSWHLAGHASIPLPVILHTDKGFEIFSSGKFEHGHATVKGKYYNYRLKDERVIAVDEQGNELPEVTASIKDFSITKNVLALFISIVLLLAIFIPVANRYKKEPSRAPSGFQSLLEPIILFIQDNIAIPNIGKKKYEKYMPFLLTVFFFILINNLLGLIPFFPGGANVTGNISITFTLAAIVLIIVMITANKHYWQHILAMPGVPKPVLLILTPVEILGFFIRPFVLMMRLFANITAGHIVILSFISLIFVFYYTWGTVAGFGISVFSMLLVIFMSLLELLVAFLQAYVFTLLSAIYFGSAIEDSHHDDSHH
ncbi:MAG: F0F1 ATP synthase subunit A [Chitinophagales bacterium]|nr:F0F1 ATP synthase subunit A [Chitinophagales bacterium]MDW8419826.1 F0F1 ATP synthase subunit A [Chitinophagales bacterium]